MAQAYHLLEAVTCFASCAGGGYFFLPGKRWLDYLGVVA
jgi:hypothetical protein